jgi:hypothetical protein
LRLAAMSCEFPVAKRPPAETVPVVSRVGLAIVGAAAAGSFGAATAEDASGGGAPNDGSARAIAAPELTEKAQPIATIDFIGLLGKGAWGRVAAKFPAGGGL